MPDDEALDAAYADAVERDADYPYESAEERAVARERRNQREAVAAVRQYREADPQGWTDYIVEAEEMSGADAPVADEW